MCEELPALLNLVRPDWPATFVRRLIEVGSSYCARRSSGAGGRRVSGVVVHHTGFVYIETAAPGAAYVTRGGVNRRLRFRIKRRQTSPRYIFS